VELGAGFGVAAWFEEGSARTLERIIDEGLRRAVEP
jgi:hypothetical protein